MNYAFGHISVHPCDKADKGGCDQTCEKKGEEERICSCGVGFKLNADGQKCDKSMSIISNMEQDYIFEIITLLCRHFIYYFVLTIRYEILHSSSPL